MTVDDGRTTVVWRPSDGWSGESKKKLESRPSTLMRDGVTALTVFALNQK